MDEEQMNRLLLEGMVMGLVESCQNIRLSTQMRETLMGLYDYFSERSIQSLSQEIFARLGKRRVRQEEFLSQLVPMLSGVASDMAVCYDETPQCRDSVERYMRCCCAIWVKEEARELQIISSYADWLGYLDETPSSWQPPDTLKCRRELVLDMLKEDFVLDSSETDHSVPEKPDRVSDMFLVMNATDVIRFLNKGFGGDIGKAEFIGSMVPTFYRRRIMANGMRPQQYLAGIAAVLAELLPDGETLTLDVTEDSFVFESPSLGKPLYLSESKVWFERQEEAVDSELLTACYTLWAKTGLTLDPLAFSVPFTSAARIREKLDGDAVYQVQQLLANGTRLPVRIFSKDAIVAITDLIRRSEMKTFVWMVLRTFNGEMGLVSWPAILQELQPQKHTGPEIASGTKTADNPRIPPLGEIP